MNIENVAIDNARITEDRIKGIALENATISNISIGSSIVAANPVPPTYVFKGKDEKKTMRLEPNGDIYFNGELAKNSKEAFEGMSKLLRDNGY